MSTEREDLEKTKIVSAVLEELMTVMDAARKSIQEIYKRHEVEANFKVDITTMFARMSIGAALGAVDNDYERFDLMVEQVKEELKVAERLGALIS